MRRVLSASFVSILVAGVFFQLVLVGESSEQNSDASCESPKPQQDWPALVSLENMLGFAREAQTVGGEGKPDYLVTDFSDSGAEASSGLTLRAAIACAKSSRGGTIRFSQEERSEQHIIHLEKPLRLPSNITLDGGAESIELIGNGFGSLIYARSVQNVIVTRLRMTMAIGQKTNQGDCITISHGSDRVWIAYNEITACNDGLVDVTQNDGMLSRVSITHNRFYDHDKSILVTGNDVTPDCARNKQCRQDMQLSLFENVFWSTGQRHPRVSGNAFVHVAGNVIAFQPALKEDGTLGGSYGALASNGAHLLITGNVFWPLDQTRDYRIASYLETESDCGVCGSLRFERNTIVGREQILPKPRRQSFAPELTYTKVPTSEDKYLNPHERIRNVLLNSGTGVH